ncbi:MAG: cation:proton antiporter, partial [Halodesulfurarchaeum sp.]
LGIHAILGAFFAGLLIATITHEGHEIERSMKPVIDLGAPVFFFYVGMNFHVTSVFQTDAVLIATVVLLGLGSKAIGALIGGALTDLPRRTTFLLAAAVPGRLSISVAAAEIGLERGIIQPALYDAFVILSVISVFVSVFAFRAIFWDRSATGGTLGAG